MNFGILNEFTRYLNRKLISEKRKTVKKSWADFWPEASRGGEGSSTRVPSGVCWARSRQQGLTKEGGPRQGDEEEVVRWCPNGGAGSRWLTKP
jgi:hypothetical protein